MWLLFMFMFVVQRLRRRSAVRRFVTMMYVAAVGSLFGHRHLDGRLRRLLAYTFLIMCEPLWCGLIPGLISKTGGTK